MLRLSIFVALFGVIALAPTRAHAQGTVLAGAPVQEDAVQGDEAPDASTADLPAALVDPKTKRPLTAFEIREREIDKFDRTKALVQDDSDPNALTDRDQPVTTEKPKPEATSQSAPLPGSVAASTAASSGSSDGEFAGPSVLTRSYTLSRPMNAQSVRLTGSLGFSQSWDIGQAAGIQAADGTYPSTTQQSRTFNWGLNGRHKWKRAQLGIGYTGSYSYASANSLTGLNDTLNLDYTYPLSRRLSLNAVENLQVLSQNYSVENPALEPGTSAASINSATSPNLQLPGNSTKQTKSTVSLTWQRSTRTSFNISATRLLIGHTGVGFIGNRSSQFTGDVNYRLTSRSTIGAFYSFTQYDYSHNVSSSWSHGAGIEFSRAINSTLQLRTRAGINRIETMAYTQMALPPELAFLLGQPAVIVNAYSLRRTSDLSAELVRDFHRNRTANISYSQGQSPGNGVLLTSIQHSLTAGYSAQRLFGIPISAGYIWSSITATSGGSLNDFSSTTYYFSTTRRSGKSSSSVFRFDYRQYRLAGTAVDQHDLRFSLTFNFNLPENWLRF